MNNSGHNWLEMYIKRELEDEIEKSVDSKEIIGILGARQCGKTTLVNTVLKAQEKKGKKST